MLGYERNKMSYNLTETDLQVMIDWERSRAASYRLSDKPDNVDIVVGFIRSKFGKITQEGLDAAVATNFRSLDYMPGFEHPVVKQQIAQKAKDAADKAQAERDRPVAFSADSFAVDTPLERFVGCLLLWIVFVPLYVSSTSRPAADPIAECAPLI